MSLRVRFVAINTRRIFVLGATRLVHIRVFKNECNTLARAEAYPDFGAVASLPKTTALAPSLRADELPVVISVVLGTGQCCASRSRRCSQRIVLAFQYPQRPLVGLVTSRGGRQGGNGEIRCRA